MAKRIIKIDMNRVEGGLEIKLEVDGHTVTDAWCVGTMYRGYEQILVGRDPKDALVITPQRQDCQLSGNHAGKLERLTARFIGLEIKDLDNPIELCHVVRSHDACLVCTVHFVKSGKKRTFLV